MTTLFVFIFGTMLVLFSFVLYNVSNRNQESNFDIALYNHAVDLSQSINYNLFGDINITRDLESTEGKVFPFAVGKSFLQIVSPNGRVIAKSRTLGTAKLPVYTEDLVALPASRVVFRTIDADSIHPHEPGET